MGRFRGIAIDVRPLRESRPFRLLWIGQTISGTGNAIAVVVVPYQLYQLTHSTLMLGLLGLCSLAPLLVAPLVGGAIADAVDRRMLILLSDSSLLVMATLFAVNAALPHPQVWALFALVTLATIFTGLGWPARRSSIPRLVAPDQIAAASTLQGLSGNFSRVAGPALGGLLIAAIGVPAAFLIDAASFGVSIAAALMLPVLKPPAGAERASLASILEGFRFVRSQKAVLGIFLLDANAMVFGMPRALFPAIVLHRFGGDASVLGLLYAAPYAGALVATFGSGWFNRIRRMGVGVAVSASAWGAAIVAFGLSRSLWPALLCLALAGAADMVSAVLRTVMVVDVTPDSMRGRVAGIELMQVTGAPALGDLEAGGVASITSLRFSVVFGGVACIAGSLLITLALPTLLRYDAQRVRRERIARDSAAGAVVGLSAGGTP